MPRLRDHPDDLAALIGATAQARDLDPEFVEKDFWITEILRAATVPVDIVAADRSEHPVRTIFKGGTSLSRAYGLIERFSEDVDLLVGFPAVEVSMGARERVLKGIRDAVIDHLGFDATRIEAVTATKGVKRNVRFHYREAAAGGQALISSGVLLEMGCRGGTYPTQRHSIRSTATEHAVDDLGDASDTWDEFAAVDVEVLAPERTLFEKLALLHDGVTRYPDEAARGRLLKAGRHIYDVARLLADPTVIAALESLGTDGVRRLCDDIESHSAAAEFSWSPRPAGGYRDSALLQLTPLCREVLESAYEVAMGLVYGARPSFDECLDTIRGRIALL